MARYWQATTFKGFYVEGRDQERQIAQQLSDALGGTKTSEIMGAGVYLWLSDADDPALRIKDIGDRSLVEFMLVDRSVIKKKAVKPKPDAAESEASGVVAEAPKLPPTGGPVEDLFMRVDGVLGGLYERVADTPDEMMTQVDLKLERWERPKPMTIASGAPTGGDIEISAGGRGGGIGGLIALVLAVVVVGGGGYYFLTTAGNDPYFTYMPGTQYEREPGALGFLQEDTERLVVVNVPTRLDTSWGSSPRFVRSETDTTNTLNFRAIEITELRVNKQRMPSVILEPVEEAQESTANELDVASLTWNEAEAWQDWFETEINRALVRGTLVREEGTLYLQAGDNKVGLELSDLLTDEQRLAIRYSENRGRSVLLEIRYQETYAYGQVRSAQSDKLFSAEVRQITILYDVSD
jgi:hypothetical protein